MIISNNIPALQAATNLGKSNKVISKSMNNLSIGTKINSAKDDAAGMAIANKLRVQLKGLNTASQNAMDGISLIQTAEGALNEVHNMLQRMRELCVYAANGTNTDSDREIIQMEVEAMKEEITASARKTEFNKIKILSGELYKNIDTLGNEDQFDYWKNDENGNPRPDINLTGFSNELTLQIGPNQSMEADISIPKVTSLTLGLIPKPASLGGGGGVDVVKYPERSIAAADEAIDRVSKLRSHLGANQNRLEHTVLSLDNTAQNTDTARSRIEDTDMAYETTLYSSKQVMAQAAISIIAQANQRPQSVLQLL